ncbi:MAG TPA: polysaccharide biosynthesis tyrosine autokinase [Bacteroidales bacterium]|nr:polysaccharide biosynthesis tyrosine autokinase [Bacteroidales bacterium]
MTNQETFKNGPLDKHSPHRNVLDPEVIISLILKNWYFFAVAILLALLGARIYTSQTTPTYRTSTTVLINETEDRPIVDNTQLLQGLGLPGGFKNLQNQIMILRSGALIERTLNELPFEISYYFKSMRKSVPVYPETPVRIFSDKEIPLPRNTEFSITFLGNDMFNLESTDKNYPFLKTASFDEIIEIPGGSFQIACFDERWLNVNQSKTLYFTIHNPARIVRYYASKLSVEQVNRDGSILRISLEGTNRAKDVDFLNKHIKEFQAISLGRKNTEAERRISFIDDQLVGITDSLMSTENRLQQFRSTHRVMDLSVQGQALIGQATLLENERARLELEANYYDYLADYLSKDITGEIPIVPITMGITDAGLTRLVDELTLLQGQLANRGAGDLNPLQKSLEQRIRNTKEALRETLNGLRRANSLARSENQSQINRANAQASSLPVTERQLLGIERKFRLNDELYTFLLETRAEQLMQKASNRPDSEVIDPADERFSILISPIPFKVNLIGVAGAMSITFLIVFLNLVFNKKLKEEEIRRITSIPIIGHIPQSNEKGNTVVVSSPGSTISETFRQLRTRIQFFTKGAESPVILVTSSMPGEGKTFLSINLASAYSLLGKRTILIGFDLRKPKIYQDFDLSNDRGISTWLIGESKLEEIIQVTTVENLSIIAAGPVPPNPSELTALAKTGELFKTLKKTYDIIIVDTSPIGIVSDTIHLSSMADVCLLVIRPGHTLRDMLEVAMNEISSNGIKDIGIVLNGIQNKGKHYGYVGKYGYTNDNNHSPKSLKQFKKNRAKGDTR